MDDIFKQVNDLVKATKELREEVKGLYQDLPQMDRIEALLVDIFCLLKFEFYLRPRQ